MYLCIDYRELNKRTMKNKYPISCIEDMFDQLNEVTMFSNIYPRLGYHKIKIREGDVPKIAFRTMYGHFESYVIWTHQCPCGIHRINELSIQGVSHTSVIVFIDDILVYSKMD